MLTAKNTFGQTLLVFHREDGLKEWSLTLQMDKMLFIHVK